MPLWFSEILYYVLFIVLGLTLGSYLNSWMWRVHEKKYVLGGRSECVHCGRHLAWYENIPLASFLFLRGKCRTCKKAIPMDYFWVELVGAILFAFLAYYDMHHVLVPLRIGRDILFLGILIVTFVYDAKYGLVLSGVTWAGALLGFIINYFYLHYSLSSLFFGLLIGGGFFLFQYVVSKGRWIGGGDVRLGAMMGLWLGFPNILLALFVSYVLGSLVAVPLLVTKKKGMESAVPFGTFLAVGTWVALLYGDVIVAWYLRLLK